MFDALSDRLEGILGRLRSRGRLSDADVDGALREIRTALLEADVDIARGPGPGGRHPGTRGGRGAVARA